MKRVRSVPTLFTGTHCARCDARSICGCYGTIRACGSPVEYTTLEAHPERWRSEFDPLEPLAELQFPDPGPWPDVHIEGDTLPVLRRPTLGFDSTFAFDARDVRWSTRRAPSTSTMAHLCTRDSLLEYFWNHRGVLNQKLDLAGVGSVVGPTFSQYSWTTPAQGLWDVVRTAILASELREGRPTIPSISARTTLDLVRWARWFAAFPPPMISVDFGSLRLPMEWRDEVLFLRTFADELAAADALRPLVATGPSTAPRIREVLNAWPTRVVFVDKRSWHLAMKGRRRLATLEVVRDETASRQSLLTDNIREFEAAVRKVSASCGRVH